MQRTKFGCSMYQTFRACSHDGIEWFWPSKCTFVQSKKKIERIHVKKHQFQSQISALSSTTPRIFHIFAPNKVHHPATVSIDL
jgi:hypothetical protein